MQLSQVGRAGITTHDYHFGEKFMAWCDNDTTSKISSMSPAFCKT